MPTSDTKYEVEYHVNDPCEPLDAVKHESFEGHIPHPPGLALGVQRQLFRSGATTGLYCHDDFYEMYIVRAGRGTSVINRHTYALMRGDVFIVSPGGAHGLMNYEGIETDVFYFQTQLFSRAELAALRQMKGFWKLLLYDGDSAQDRKNARRLHLSPDQHGEVETLIERIRAEICEPPPLGPLLAHQLFFHLLTQLARWHSRTNDGARLPARLTADDMRGAESAGHHARRLADVVRYCEENLDRPLTVPLMAARMFVSPDHFSRLFTANMGVPPAAYLRNLRLARAQTLLRTTELPVSEIARQIGMRDPDQLSHAFRSSFAISPREYRAQFRK